MRNNFWLFLAIGIFIAALALASCERIPPYDLERVKAEVNSLMDKHDVYRRPVVLIGDEYIEIKDSLAETACLSLAKFCKISFRPCALKSFNAKELIIHESMHVVAYQRYGVSDHGKEWKQLMRSEGFIFPQERLYNFNCK